MKYQLAYSPCPNDTYIFGALATGKIQCENVCFDITLHDIAVLNAMAEKGEADVLKVSFSAFAGLTGRYDLLTTGSALGFGVGPLLISLPNKKIAKESALIAIPGKNTTAAFLYQYCISNKNELKEYRFSDIEKAVTSGECDAGVIIHENRFTYHKKGLVKQADLGEMYEKKTNYPIPLGGIAVKNDLSPQIKSEINHCIKSSLSYAEKNISQITPYIKKHAREMESDVIKDHISLYVNDYTRELGKEGRDAVLQFLQLATHSNFTKFSFIN